MRCLVFINLIVIALCEFAFSAWTVSVRSRCSVPMALAEKSRKISKYYYNKQHPA